MTHIFIGCDKIARARNVYFQNLRALEVTGTFDHKISAKRLGQWRTESPHGFAFSMLASRGLTHTPGPQEELPASLAEFPRQDLGMLQQTEAVMAAWRETLGFAKALSPKFILLQTPATFTPTDKHRERIEYFARELAPLSQAKIAWQPHGLWEPETTIPWTRSLGLVPVFDPFADIELPPGRGTAYFYLYQRRGLRARFHDFDMEELLEKCEPYQRAFMVFRGTENYRDARLAMKVWESNVEMEDF